MLTTMPMSFEVFGSSPPEQAAPYWLRMLAEAESLPDGATLEIGGRRFVVRSGIARSSAVSSHREEQTRETFGFKWSKRDTFESPASLAHRRAVVIEPERDL